MLPKNAQNNNSKTLILSRHAEGEHNVALAQFGPTALYTLAHFDAPLSLLGKQSCRLMREAISSDTSLAKIYDFDLLLVSPLQRTIQTAQILFPEKYSVLSYKNIVSLECCRERYGLHYCDKRRPRAELVRSHPEIEFTLDSEEDELWTKMANQREEFPSLKGRIEKLLKWISEKEESKIAVVTHSTVLFYLWNLFLNVENQTKRRDLNENAQKGYFEPCESRVVNFVFE